ncbi:LysM peptidoglycan-binding domain-containing protein [Vallitalea sp.]|jgi:nucleoid-associated protein YgaU|uniref:LysM peptidoglycan-binding domain-containing protein n=1 Tax=Vallitalea sp. TaxID=1882829 RepID=UPI0025DABB47|nr:LysM peptidoglycan-binding domain-containing protein [Vallitalea sp.]MCT4686087.1 LysM peptidoglycan-binding domain-containing protein [Vallitalea sp.]
MSKIYLSYNNQTENLELPILPKKIEVKEKGNNKSHTLQNIGEISVINKVKASIIKIDSIFPLHYGPYVTSKILKDPVEYINTIKRWRDSNKPIRLVITDTAFPLTMACTIENLSYKEAAGAVGDIEYSIELKEYRWHKVNKVVTASKQAREVTFKTSRPIEKETPKNYIVKKGDTLYAICKRQLGNGNKYKDIARKNDIKNPNLIYPGQVLKL